MKELDEQIVNTLRDATTREAVEGVFNRFEVKDTDLKTQYIKEAMHNPEIFYSSGKDTSMEQQYELILQMLLARSWKLYDYYEKLGLVQHGNNR